MELENRKLILHKYNENPSWTILRIAKSLKMSHKTVGNVINRFKQTLSIERAEGSGKKPGPQGKKLAKKIIQSVKSNPGLSDRDRANKIKTSVSNVRRTQKRESYGSYHVIKTPNRSDKQSESTKNRFR